MISFSDPYLHLHHALLLNRLRFAQIARNRPVEEVVRAFDGTIGVVEGSSYASFAATSFPRAKIVVFPDWEAVIKALDAGEIMAAYRDEFEIRRVLKKDPTAVLRLRVVTFTDLDDAIAIGVNVIDKELLDFVNRFLSERKEQLDVNALLRLAD
jgi:ABC-type amino acid transport substrate-binding protein